MKVNWNSKYNTVAVYSLIVICISILFYFFASQIGSFSAKISYLISILYPFIILIEFNLLFIEARMSNSRDAISQSIIIIAELNLVADAITRKSMKVLSLIQ